MPKYVINEGYDDARTVEGASSWNATEDFVIFRRNDAHANEDSVVFAIVKSNVTTITTVAD